MGLYKRKITESDYDDLLVGWWKSWGWEAPPRDFLPNNGCGGIIVMDGNIPVCAGFMYLTNSKAAWVDWIISNKEYRKKPLRKEAIEMLIESLTNICKSAGNKYCYALLQNSSLIKTYETIGYVRGGKDINEMIKQL